MSATAEEADALWTGWRGTKVVVEAEAATTPEGTAIEEADEGHATPAACCSQLQLHAGMMLQLMLWWI